MVGSGDGAFLRRVAVEPAGLVSVFEEEADFFAGFRLEITT
jgi:hypothetical protein